jgi:hypothetical protein
LEKIMKKLYDIIKEHSDIARLDDPQWDKRRKFNDWRNYVPDGIRDNWKFMVGESRILVYITAQQAANRENWDN